jgi:Kef-type K+ transport system membrane component KefB
MEKILNQIRFEDITLFFFQISAMLAVALVFGQIMRRLRQPAVLGELIGGIILGPTVAGHLAPQAFHSLFPANPAVTGAREAMIGIGMLFFLFVAGLEVNLAHLRQRRLCVVLSSLLGCFLPFAQGFASVLLFPRTWGELIANEQLMLALFIGTALSISALPVITRILMDLRLIQQEIGSIVMTAATMNDLIGWSLFAVLLCDLDLTRPWADIGRILLGVTLFSLLVLGTGRWLGPPFLKWVRASLVWPSGFISSIIIFILMAAALADLFGVHAIFGAFLVGVALHRVFKGNDEDQVKEIIHQFAISFFAPLYFVSIGLKADFAANFDPHLVFMVILLATTGKVGGASLGAWLGGISRRKALAIGFGMNARGAMEMILASVALDHGMIDQRIFVALVTMALVTSMLSGPMLQWMMRPAAEEILPHGRPSRSE